MTLPFDTRPVSAISKSQPIRDPTGKRLVACNYCRAKKIRCNGGERSACANCLDRKEPCISLSPRRWRNKDKGNRVDDVAERLARVEALLQQQPSAGNASHDTRNSWIGDSVESLSRATGQELLDQSQLQPSFCMHEDNGAESQHENLSCSTPSNPAPESRLPVPANPGSQVLQTSSAQAGLMSSTFNCDPDSVVSTAFDRSEILGYEEKSPEEICEGSSISPNETSNWEYHGPRSFLSICSKPGIQWVGRKTGTSSFSVSARIFTTNLTRRLKIERRLSTVRTPEPDQEAAWRYTRAYFDEALDSALGIVHRPWFEAQLRSYFNGTINDSDPAWYALRNAIYASGCRIELSKYKSYLEANQTAWGWFENALAAHTEILYFRTSILGVQALTLMAYYSQNIGSPCLEYMLCANALRLAVAKGLHRQAASSWNLTEQERTLRSCLFWAAYCLEKQIVCQSKRHSLIDDDDINCPVPAQTPPGGTMNLEYFGILIRLARFSSVVSKRISTVRAFQQGAELLVRSVAELEDQRNVIKRSVDSLLFLDSSINLDRLPAGMTLQQIMYLRYGFHNITLDIHTVLTHPWSRNMPGLTPVAALHNQMENSTRVVAETCRNAILATEHIHFNASTPHPLSFFGPLYALINLFIYILQTPQQPRIQSDLALMDVGAGHFARMQFATDSEISFSFAKEMAALAHQAVERASRRGAGNESIITEADLSLLQQSMSDRMTDRNVMEEDLQSDDPTAGYSNLFFDLEMENWSTFLPTEFDDNMMDFAVI